MTIEDGNCIHGVSMADECPRCSSLESKLTSRINYNPPISVSDGQSLTDAAQEQGLDLLAFCDGHRMYEGSYAVLVNADQPHITATQAIYVTFSKHRPPQAPQPGPPKIEAVPVTRLDGKPLSWVTECPYCIRILHITPKSV